MIDVKERATCRMKSDQIASGSIDSVSYSAGAERRVRSRSRHQDHDERHVSSSSEYIKEFIKISKDTSNTADKQKEYIFSAPCAGEGKEPGILHSHNILTSTKLLKALDAFEKEESDCRETEASELSISPTSFAQFIQKNR
ncbi:hypothetical protein ADUPG1_012517 [Aduncisulcus paluster]|uniref:Uncharacterized protein n=1 Tax=Aduncisulcus paluster TaxID=2918883 RepID=A0ABQ5K1J7_9EUKA|nr:hypothetical protein ADUPG1_012517 [Aduncisulcus paluster]